MSQALIIFVKNPQLGKVKTRLANAIGPERALKVYEKLLQHTRQITMPVNAKLFVYYGSFVPELDEWPAATYEKRLQLQTDSLGERMLKAFEEVFAEGYEKVAIIGSDCLQLTPAIIEEGYTALGNNDVVIGPAMDGGYYLLGMTKLYPELFYNKIWSTSTVFSETIADTKALGLAVYELTRLSDVDNVGDLPDFFEDI